MESVQDQFSWMAEDCMLDIPGCSFADGPPGLDLDHMARSMAVRVALIILSLKFLIRLLLRISEAD